MEFLIILLATCFVILFYVFCFFYPVINEYIKTEARDILV